MIKVVYFNQWFSSMANIMLELKKEYGGQIRVVASSKNPLHAYKYCCDKFILEDWEETGGQDTDDRTYIDWLKNTLKQEYVDLAFINKHMDAVNKYRSELESICELSLPCSKTYGIVSSKDELYRKLLGDKTSDGLGSLVPLFWSPGCDGDREKLHNMLYVGNNSVPLCVKLDRETGGQSFVRILDYDDRNNLTAKEFKGLKHKNVAISREAALNMLDRGVKDNKDLKDLIFMEYLEEPEISIDCYNSEQGFIGVCREKLPNSRVERVYYDKKLVETCKRIGDTLGIHVPFNAQFRFKHGDPFLIDINPRLSGGIYQETAVGLNILGAYLKDRLGIGEQYSIDSFVDFKERLVTHFEKAIEIEKE